MGQLQEGRRDLRSLVSGFVDRVFWSINGGEGTLSSDAFISRARRVSLDAQEELLVNIGSALEPSDIRLLTDPAARGVRVKVVFWDRDNNVSSALVEKLRKNGVKVGLLPVEAEDGIDPAETGWLQGSFMLADKRKLIIHFRDDKRFRYSNNVGVMGKIFAKKFESFWKKHFDPSGTGFNYA